MRSAGKHEKIRKNLKKKLVSEKSSCSNTLVSVSDTETWFQSHTTLGTNLITSFNLTRSRSQRFFRRPPSSNYSLSSTISSTTSTVSSINQRDREQRQQHRMVIKVRVRYRVKKFRTRLCCKCVSV